MRLIDADALECDAEWSEYADGYISYSKTEIDTAPTIDAVPVVRCKDCKWMEKNVFGGQYCNYRYGNIRLDDFCSCGEREEDE